MNDAIFQSLSDVLFSGVVGAFFLFKSWTIRNGGSPILLSERLAIWFSRGNSKVKNLIEKRVKAPDTIVARIRLFFVAGCFFVVLAIFQTVQLFELPN